MHVSPPEDGIRIQSTLEAIAFCATGCLQLPVYNGYAVAPITPLQVATMYRIYPIFASQFGVRDKGTIMRKPGMALSRRGYEAVPIADPDALVTLSATKTTSRYDLYDGSTSGGRWHRLQASLLVVIVVSVVVSAAAIIRRPSNEHQPHLDSFSNDGLSKSSGPMPGSPATTPEGPSPANPSPSDDADTSKTPNATNSVEQRKLRVQCQYEIDSGREIGDGKYPHKIAAVGKDNQLDLTSGESVRWKVSRGGTDDAKVVYESEEKEVQIKLRFPKVDVYTVTVSDDQGRSDSFTVYSRIVRRELRTLGKDDRKRYFDALSKMYKTSQSEGEEAYGSEWKSADWLIRLHLYGAASAECDHWHDDAGIMNHHIGITWQMEISMRLIDPTVAAHYWDYTLDAADYDTNWQSSDIFLPDWFGPASPDNADHIVDVGRWNHTEILSGRAATSFSNITNAYGLLRSPWNTNKTPYLIRSNMTLGSLTDGYGTLPECSLFQQYLQPQISLGTLLFALNGALHGPVHIMVGGHWFYDKETWGELTSQLEFADAFLLLSKFLWRQGYVRCPTCTPDTEQRDCVCTCPPDITKIGSNTSVEDFLNLTGVSELNPNANLFDLLETYGLSDDDYLEALCHVGHPGDLFTSAAPQDPLFWPLHGNGERFLQYVRLLDHAGELVLDESWGYAHQKKLPSDTGVVCDWESVPPDPMPHCFKDTCIGHREDDILLFENLTGNGPYTNREFYELVSPLDTSLPYVYDSLSYWPGCATGSLYIQE